MYTLVTVNDLTGGFEMTAIVLKNGAGKIKSAYVGFSWTTFFFGSLPALFRGDIKGFAAIASSTILLQVVMGMLMGGLGFPEVLAIGTLLLLRLVWCANYNEWHLNRLKAAGFEPQV